MPDAIDVRREEVERVCTMPGCDTRFTAQVTIIGGARLGPTICEECEAEREAEEESFQAEWGDQRPIRDRMASLGINTRKHGGLNLTDLGTPEVETVRGWVQSVLNAGKHGFVRGLYLEGPTGTGKTQLAASLVRELLEQDYRGAIVYDRARSLVTTIQDRYGGGDVDAVLDVRRKAGVWILDDIGTEKETADAYRILEDILDAREGYPNVLSSNLSRSDLVARWSDKDSKGRLASRLGPQNYQHIAVTGEDRRFREPDDPGLPLGYEGVEVVEP